MFRRKAMYKYYFEIPMFYNNVSIFDTNDSITDISFKLEKTIEKRLLININKGDFNSKEICDIIITDNNDNSLLLSIDSIYADDENYSYDMAYKIADKVCCVLTFILHSQNYNFHHFHPKLTYRIRDIVHHKRDYDNYVEYTRKQKRYKDGNETIHLSDRILLNEHIECKLCSSVNVDSFDELFSKYGSDKHFRFVLESYYRGLGEIEFVSKYYNFFTIIEYVEVKFSKYAEYKDVFYKTQSDELKELFATKIDEFLSGNKDAKNLEDRINSRFGTFLANITDKTRAEKLCDILNNHFDLNEIKFGFVNLSINADTIKNFIDVRNSLFHAKRITEEEESKLNRLTNDLMILCTMLVFKILNSK